MSKRISILAAALLILSSAMVVAAQTTVTTTPTTVVTQTPTTITKTVQNPDGTYTVIEYPVGKEVQVTLNPITLTDSKGVATILRDDNGTSVIVDMTGVPADVKDGRNRKGLYDRWALSAFSLLLYRAQSWHTCVSLCVGPALFSSRNHRQNSIQSGYAGRLHSQARHSACDYFTGQPVIYPAHKVIPPRTV